MLHNPAILFWSLMLISWASFPAMSQNRPIDAASSESLKNRVKEVAMNTRTISCDFIQEKEMSMITEKITSKGKFFLKKEKMLRWEYLQPFSYIIIIKNDHITIKDENKVNQFNVQSDKVFLEINRVILGSIQGTLLSDEQNFKATFFENSTSWVVKLTTLNPKLKESLSEIVLWFDRKDYTVSRLEMKEPGGDCTRISFSAKKLNQPIADEKFKVN
ncbi:MAG: outer membrane lipoprotein carrier protein LolA [Bacteroidetes bacterium]|nr:outer membrane lipoprotein carrier protein LolA [Bacteroidota bacterium]